MDNDVSFYDILKKLKFDKLYGEPPKDATWIYYLDEKESACDGPPRDVNGRLFKDSSGNIIPSGKHPQGYKLHVGFHNTDTFEVLRNILPILHEHKISHKIIASLSKKRKLDRDDPNNTQKGKHIAIYVSKITPDIIRTAEHGNDRPLKKEIGRARTLYKLIDITLQKMILAGTIKPYTDAWSAEGVGTDKYMGDSYTKMVGYRLGSFCDDYLYAYERDKLDKLDKLVRYKDERDFYKKIEVFQQITLTTDDIVVPSHIRKEISELRARIRSDNEIIKVGSDGLRILKEQNRMTSAEDRKMLDNLMIDVLNIIKLISESLIATNRYMIENDVSKLETMKKYLKLISQKLDKKLTLTKKVIQKYSKTVL